LPFVNEQDGTDEIIAETWFIL